MRRNVAWTLWPCLMLVAGCGAQPVLLGTTGSAVFSAMDVLATPREQVDLRAQLRSGDFLRGSPGYAVRFYQGEELYRVAQTDEDGVAAVSFTPAKAGDYAFRAELVPAGMKEPPPPPAELAVYCRPGDVPMAVVDLDKTVVASGFHTVLLGNPEPMSHSQEVLARLARTHLILYLTHRPDLFTLKSRSWLKDNGYPPGPLLLSSISGFLKGSGAFKSDMIVQLQERFTRMEIGIGDKISDAQAYRQRGMKAFLIVQIPESDEPEPYDDLAGKLDQLDEKVQVVGGWDEIEEALFGRGSYPRSDMQKRLNDLARASREKVKSAK